MDRQSGYNQPFVPLQCGHVKCKLCVKYFKTIMGREKHMVNMHSSSDDFKCTICTVKCVNDRVLQTHLAAHAEGIAKPYQCRVCGVEFTRRYHLKRHEMHTSCGPDQPKVEPISCNVCGKLFKRVDNLKEHLRAHMGEPSRKRDFQCTFCDRAFIGPSLLNIHLR